MAFHLLSRFFPKWSVLLDLYKDSGFSKTSVLCALMHNVISCAPTKTGVIVTVPDHEVPNGLVHGTVLSLGESYVSKVKEKKYHSSLH